MYAQDTELFEISVEDNGEGFADPDQVFSETRRNLSQGGFGMLGIRRLIQARGGTLTASNKTHETGARISFALPGQVLRSSGMQPDEDASANVDAPLPDRLASG